MKFILTLILIACFSIHGKAQVTDDVLQLNGTFAMNSTGGSHYGIGMAVHDFDQENWAFRISMENFMLVDLTYLLVNMNSKILDWGTPNLTHGLFGNYDLRMNVIEHDFGMTSIGVSYAHYYISGNNLLNANYQTAGLSIGHDILFSNETGLFTNLQINLPFHKKTPNMGEGDAEGFFTQFQAIYKFSWFSIDYDVLVYQGISRSNIRVGLWTDMNW